MDGGLRRCWRPRIQMEIIIGQLGEGFQIGLTRHASGSLSTESAPAIDFSQSRFIRYMELVKSVEIIWQSSRPVLHLGTSPERGVSDMASARSSSVERLAHCVGWSWHQELLWSLSDSLDRFFCLYDAREHSWAASKSSLGPRSPLVNSWRGLRRVERSLICVCGHV